MCVNKSCHIAESLYLTEIFVIYFVNLHKQIESKWISIQPSRSTHKKWFKFSFHSIRSLTLRLCCRSFCFKKKKNKKKLIYLANPVLIFARFTCSESNIIQWLKLKQNQKETSPVIWIVRCVLLNLFKNDFELHTSDLCNYG